VDHSDGHDNDQDAEADAELIDSMADQQLIDDVQADAAIAAAMGATSNLSEPEVDHSDGHDNDQDAEADAELIDSMADQQLIDDVQADAAMTTAAGALAAVNIVNIDSMPHAADSAAGDVAFAGSETTSASLDQHAHVVTPLTLKLRGHSHSGSYTSGLMDKNGSAAVDPPAHQDAHEVPPSSSSKDVGPFSPLSTSITSDGHEPVHHDEIDQLKQRLQALEAENAILRRYSKRPAQ